MSHSLMKSNVAPLVENAEYFRSHDNGKTGYVLTEVNTLNGAGNATFSFSLATALWKTDFMMYLMTKGVKRVHFEQVSYLRMRVCFTRD
jgi:hypothetical protein